jgi:hypothetical protein
MIGICSESFVWITHFLFTISRVRPKLNLKKLIMKSRYLSKGKDFKIQPRKIEFNMGWTCKKGSLFINILIRKMIIEWYFILFYHVPFLLVKSGSTIMDILIYVCLSFYFLFLYVVNKNIKWIYIKENSRIIIIEYIRIHI